MFKTTLAGVELPATDLQATKDFYTRYFGWEWTDYGPTYAGSTSSGVEVGVTTQAPSSPLPERESQAAIGPLVLFQAEDVAPIRQAMVDGGAQIMTDTFEFPGGRRFHVQDPGGNVIGIFQYE